MDFKDGDEKRIEKEAEGTQRIFIFFLILVDIFIIIDANIPPVFHTCMRQKIESHAYPNIKKDISLVLRTFDSESHSCSINLVKVISLVSIF